MDATEFRAEKNLTIKYKLVELRARFFRYRSELHVQ